MNLDDKMQVDNELEVAAPGDVKERSGIHSDTLSVSDIVEVVRPDTTASHVRVCNCEVRLLILGAQPLHNLRLRLPSQHHSFNMQLIQRARLQTLSHLRASIQVYNPLK